MKAHETNLKAEIYIHEDELMHDQPLYEFILKFLRQQHIQGATVFMGRFGYGDGLRLSRPHDLFSFDETPCMITFIDESEKVKSALTALREVVAIGLIITHTVEKW